MNCLHCGRQLVKRGQQKYCSNRCQRDKEYHDNITAWLTGQKRAKGNLGHAVSIWAKRWLIETRGEQCEQCGWNQRNPVTQKVPIEVDHIDGNHDNDRPENLRLLCPNCHSLTPTYKALNKGRGRSHRK